ncbi:hypothetical protein PVL29_018670 [Vitis rotundifolia]|uniref:Uncharacterized protein n=1 Tax=Vitis rotundifolia TaxID=103349 RepID=A0AA38Z5S0_VITRO|nr:hypothetical protein PVL29_018670 [Vitis rotundifolia]
MAKSKESSKQYSLQKGVVPKENYTTVKGLFLWSSGKPLRMHEEGTKNDILSCERSLEDTNNMNVNEHYLHTLSNEKLCTEDLNEKNEDACSTSIEVHIIPDENQNILPLPIKREPLQALCGYPDHVMKTRTSRERKPSKFKVSPFVHNLKKMVKRQASEVEFCQTFFKLYDIRKDVFQFSIDWAPSISTQDNGFKNGDSMTSSDFCNSVKIRREIACDLVLHEGNREKQTIVAIICTKTSTRAMKILLL